MGVRDVGRQRADPGPRMRHRRPAGQEVMHQLNPYARIHAVRNGIGALARSLAPQNQGHLMPVGRLLGGEFQHVALSAGKA